MEIKSTITNNKGQVFNVVYKDIEGELEIAGKNISGVHALCFYKDKLVIVYSKSKGYWGPPGGGLEKGENIRDAIRREVKEETNMKVVELRFLGYQDIFKPEGIISQARPVCIVEPCGDFINDPDGDVTEIKLIDPKDFKKYFDWGIVGDRLMERALEAKAQII